MALIQFKKRRVAIDLNHAHATALQGYRKGPTVYLEKYFYQPFDTPMFVPGFRNFQINDQDRLAAVFNGLLQQLDTKETNISLVVPEQMVKVVIIPFENFPVNKHESLDVVKWRLKSTYGQEVENFRIAFQALRHSKDEKDYVLIGLSHRKAIHDLLQLLEQFNLNIIQIEVPSICLFNLFESRLNSMGDRDFYFVSFTSQTINVMLFENFVPVFYRSTDLRKSPILIEEDIYEEILQALKISILYNEENRRGKIVKQVYLHGDNLNRQNAEESIGEKLGADFSTSCLDFQEEVEWLCPYTSGHVVAPAAGILA